MCLDGCAHAFSLFFLVAANHSLSLERCLLWRPWLILHLRLQPFGGQRTCNRESLQQLLVLYVNGFTPASPKNPVVCAYGAHWILGKWRNLV